MLCAIYKSKNKAGTYLYVEKRDYFDEVPAPLLEVFGSPQFVMLFNLKGNKSLHQVENRKVMQQIEDNGFYLQIPKENDGLFNSL